MDRTFTLVKFYYIETQKYTSKLKSTLLTDYSYNVYRIGLTI